jgi:DNA-3-methyladenine glycosylase II
MSSVASAFMLHPTAPYRFDLICDLLSRYPHAVSDVVKFDLHDQPRYLRALRLSGGVSLWQVTAQGDALQATSLAGTVSNHSEAQATLGWICNIDADSASFFDYAETQPALWKVVAPLKGLRWLRTPTVFEALVSLIIEQHISWASAQRWQLAMLAQIGDAIEYYGQRYYVYPTPERLAAASAEDLAEVKITTKRKALLIDLAAQIASGKLDIECLRELPPDEMYKRLLELKGIGPWTAANVVMRATGAMTFVPSADVALQAATNHYFNGETGKLTAAQTDAVFAQFAPYAGEAAHYTLTRWVFDHYPRRTS